MSQARHPLQPVVMDEHGVIRFKPNKIVEHLLRNGKINLNEIALLGFDAEDLQQLAQLIGYSLDGYSDLSYVDDAAWAAAEQQRHIVLAPVGPPSAQDIVAQHKGDLQ